MYEVLMKFLEEMQSVPGLGFLSRYREQIMAKKDDFDERIEVLEGQTEGVRRGMKSVRDVPKNVKGSKRST